MREGTHGDVRLPAPAGPVRYPYRKPNAWTPRAERLTLGEGLHAAALRSACSQQFVLHCRLREVDLAAASSSVRSAAIRLLPPNVAQCFIGQLHFRETAGHDR